MARQAESMHEHAAALQRSIAGENRQGEGIPAQDTGAVHNKQWHVTRFLGDWLTTATAGVSALGLVRVLAPWLGFTVKINLVSLALAACLGAPGVVLLLFLRLCFWRI
ncbi:MAG: pro-sigmaK processing inhibitor BofA family protein [Faecalibacterium sp.]